MAIQVHTRVNPHLSQPLVEWGMPAARARSAVIALHGRDRDPEDILDVCARLDRPDLAYLIPAAANASWYPLSFMADLKQNEPGLADSLERVETLMRWLVEKRIDPARIVLLGFSQGACVVAEAALRTPRRYGAVLVFTGGAFGTSPSQWNYSGDLTGTPVLVSGSLQDRWVPVERRRETAALFATRGGRVVEHYYEGSEHFVNDGELTAARRLLESI